MKKDFLSFPRDAKIYLLSEFFRAGYFTWPFWYGFATGRITPSQFGIFLAVGYLVGMVAEVPTGAFADSYGRKRSAILGAILIAAIPLTIYFGGNFFAYLVAAVLTGIGGAFISGSLESLVYELPTIDKHMYRVVTVQAASFFQAGLIISAAVGGIMYKINHLLPFVSQAASFLIMAILVGQISAVEARTRGKGGTRQERLSRYAATNKEGFLHLFTVRKLWPLLLFGSTLSLAMWMGIENLNEAAMIHYGITPASRGLVIAGFKVVALVILNLVIIRKIKSDRAKLLYLGTLTTAVFSFYAVGSKSFFLVAFLVFNLISSIQDNFIRPIIHDHIADKWRATAISSYSFIGNALQAIASLAIGGLLQYRGIVFVQRCLLAMILFVSIPALVRFLNKTKPIKTSQ